jgi:hypothetical protein
MCLERITDSVPRFVAQPAITKIKHNKAFVFFEGASDCKQFMLELTVCQTFQTTVSAQPIRENGSIEQ